MIFLLFSCDIWRSTKSMELQGAYDDVDILQQDIINIFRGELEEYYKENNCNTFDIEDILDQKIEYIHIIQLEINERL